MTAPETRGLGLALSGGAARGIAHIAVLDTLDREGIPIGSIAGTSAGSVVGALYAAGMPVAEIKRILLQAKWRDVLKLTVPKYGLISSDGIFRFMESILPIHTFSELPIPFAAVAANLRDGEKVSLTSGSISRAIQASCSLPVIFSPTKINKRLLVDGGLASQIPVRTVREELGAGKVIAVNVNYRAIELDRLDNVILIAAHLSALWASRNAQVEIKLADVEINVDVRGIPLYDLTKAEELLRRGQKAAEAQLPAIEALLKA